MKKKEKIIEEVYEESKPKKKIYTDESIEQDPNFGCVIWFCLALLFIYLISHV